MKEPKETHTKGNVIVQNIKVGDTHYEYEYGVGIKLKVLTKPRWIEDGYEWKSKCIETGKIINYFINPKYSHYSSNLYDYEAYKGVKYIKD